MGKKADSGAEDRILKALEARGEAFLRLFDDPSAAKRPQSAQAAESSGESDSVSGEEPAEGASSGEEAQAAPGGLDEVFRSPRKPSGRPAVMTQPGGLSSRKAKRLFMSGKAALVHSQAGAKRAKTAAGPGEEDGLTREQFRDMQREVGAFGASGLDKKDQKRFNDAQLKALGMTPEKNHRIPANVGYRMAANARAREQKALEEGIASGMVQQKGLGKRKRRQQERERRADPGLREDGGAFRKGKLDLRLLERRRRGGKRPHSKPGK